MHIISWTWGPARAGGLQEHTQDGTLPGSIQPTQSGQRKALWKGKHHSPVLLFFRLRKLRPIFTTLDKASQNVGSGFLLLASRLCAPVAKQQKIAALLGWVQLMLFPVPCPQPGGNSSASASLSWGLTAGSVFWMRRCLWWWFEFSVVSPSHLSSYFFPFQWAKEHGQRLVCPDTCFPSQDFYFSPFLMNEWQKHNSGTERAKLLSKEHEMAQGRAFSSKISFPFPSLRHSCDLSHWIILSWRGIK